MSSINKYFVLFGNEIVFEVVRQLSLAGELDVMTLRACVNKALDAKLSQPAISKSLKALGKNGVVTMRKNGWRHLYRVADPAPFRAMIDTLEEMMSPQVAEHREAVSA